MPTNDSEATSSSHHKPSDSQLRTAPTLRERGWQKLASLDGESRAYTLTVLTTLAFTIATVYFDVGFLETDKDDEVLLEQTVALHSLSAAGRQIVRALVLLLLCLFIGAYSFMLLSINVYKFDEEQLNRHRLWLTLSFISAVVANFLVVIIMVTSQLKYNDRDDEHDKYESGFSHYLLFSILFLSTVAMDFFFLEACNTSYKKLIENEEKNEKKQKRRRIWSNIRKEFAPNAQKTPAEGSNGGPGSQPTMRSRIASSIRAMFTWLLQKTSSGTNAIVCGLRWLLDNLLEGVASQKTITEDISDSFLDIFDSIEQSRVFQTWKRMISYLTWGIWNPPKRTDIHHSRNAAENEEDPGMKERTMQQMAQSFRGTVQYWRDFGEKFRAGVDELYAGIREDDKFHHSSWVLAAMCTAFVLLLYFGVGIASYTSKFIDEMYIPRRNCAVWTIENNGELGNFVFRLAGFTEASSNAGQAFNARDETELTNAACSVDTSSIGADFDAAIFEDITATFGTQQPLDQPGNQTADPDMNPPTTGERETPETELFHDSRYFRCSSETHSDNSCMTLLLINRLERSMNASLNETKTPTDVFRDQAIGRSIYVVDQLLRHLRWSIWVGLMAGIVVGMYSLLSVLAQYKRISLAIRSGFFENLDLPEDLVIKPQNETEANIHRVEDIVTERNWKKLIVRYPMGASVFFFGILVSTAVIQLVLFGGLVSLLLSLIVSIFEHRVFVILRPFLAFLIAFLITWLLNGPLAQMVIAEGILVQKYHIYHELCFLLFLLVYTAVHLVLGVFFALMRLFWVLITTIACLNRLDRNLFPILQQNDLGHKSFMSTVLMQHAFLENASTGERHPFAVIVARLRESQQKRVPVTPPDGSPPNTPTTVYAVVQTTMAEGTSEIQEETEEGNVAYLHDGFGSNDANIPVAASSTPNRPPIV